MKNLLVLSTQFNFSDIHLVTLTMIINSYFLINSYFIITLKVPGDDYIRLRDLVGEIGLALCLKGVSSISLILCFTY